LGVVSAIHYRPSFLEISLTLTLLLDLDDTLLANDMAVFLPAYLQSLGNHLKPFVAPDTLIPALLTATQQMLHNNLPDRTQKQVFDATFYPIIDLTIETLEEPLSNFYSEEFPKLRELTTSEPEAVRFVEQSMERGYDLAIATNPLFPLTANLQRLEWAGLPANKYPFRLIPSNESFHFAKPKLAFFTELLGRLGWPEGQHLMVGDNLDHDIIPAQKIGLPTFHLSNQPTVDDHIYRSTHGSGSLADLLPWLDSIPEDDLNDRFDHPEGIMAIIRSTPAIISSFTSSLPTDAWFDEPRADEWSLTEIICHLRDVDGEVNLPRLKKVLEDTNPFLPGIDTDQWADERLYYCQDGKSALDDFTRFRIELINILERLPRQDLERSARHAIFGPTQLIELVGIIARHDRLHVQQAYKTLGEIVRIPGD
jgi:FMN phosphatase YigB (HAD superfamily)